MSEYVLLSISTIVSTLVGVIAYAFLGKATLPLTTRFGAALGGGAVGSFGGMILAAVYHLDEIAFNIPWISVFVGTLMSISFQKYVSDSSRQSED
jgi:predicted permease